MGGLIERSAEIDAIRELLAGAASDHGSSVVLSGPAGIGRTALLEAGRTTALTHGFRVLVSSLTPVSAALSHGVVHDWLSPLVRERGAGGRPFDGPAKALAQELASPGTAAHVWDLASLDNALTWALQSLTQERPLLLVVDDVQWADVGSLQVLDLLSARIAHARVGLLLGRRTGEPGATHEIVLRLAKRATVLEPRPLSPAAVALVRDGLSPQSPWRRVPAEELHRRTGGSPFLLRELLRSGDPARPPRGVVESVRDRLDRLGPDALALARASAVLGDDAGFDGLAELTGLDVPDLADPLQVLADSGIVVPGMWRATPAHPLVAEAVLTAMAPSERSALHRAAARHLAGSGRDGQDVAAHLLHTVAEGDPAVAELLRSVGEESLRSGRPDLAARQLLRAAGETAPQDTPLDLLAQAAAAHLSAGLRDEALELWATVLQRASAPADRARHLMELGDAQLMLGELAGARTSYDDAADALSADGSAPLSRERRSALARTGIALLLHEGTRSEILESVRAVAARPPSEDTEGDRLLLALGALDHAVRGEDRPTAGELALRALGTSPGCGPDPDLSPACPTFTLGAAVLIWSDAFDAGLPLLDAAVDEGRRQGSVPGFATASYLRGLMRYRRGDLRAALAEFDAALDMRTRGWRDFADTALAGSVLVHVGLGQHELARALEAELREAGARGGLQRALPMAAAGVVRAVHGDHEQALEDYAAARRLMGDHADNGSVVEWRELSVWSLAALGRHTDAARLAEEAVLLARRWGAPRGLGFALRAQARVAGADEAIPLLREAVGVLETGGCLESLARARIELALQLLPTDRDEAVAHLRSSLAYGVDADVPPVALRARRALARAGVRAEPDGRGQVGSLTPGELRVASLAASGASNREIARSLGVSVKAVEWHLSNTFRKLSLRSRDQLPGVLGPDDPSSSSAR